jgi:arylsulfatase A-like enzyme
MKYGLPFLSDLLHEDQLGHVAVPPYEEIIRVPLFIRLPDTDTERRGEIVQTLDLAPTILEFAGIDPPQSMQGRSLTPNASFDGRDIAFVRTNQTPGGATYAAARSNDRKVVSIEGHSWENDTKKFYLGRRFFTQTEQAFSIEGDTDQRVPIGEEERKLFETLDRHANDCKSLAEEFATESIEISKDRQDHLEEMGYL